MRLCEREAGGSSGTNEGSDGLKNGKRDTCTSDVDAKSSCRGLLRDAGMFRSQREGLPGSTCQPNASGRKRAC